MKTELRKSLFNLSFLLTLGIMCAISIASACSIIKVDITHSVATVSGKNPALGIRTLYNRWIAMVWDDPYSAIFFNIFPLAAALPNGLSLYSDRKNGYMAQMILRKTRTRYFSEKFVATFFSGGLVITIPVILNIMITALHFPIRKPDLYFDIYTSVQPFSFASTYFYTVPFVHLLLRVLIIFLYSGTAAVMCLAMTCFSRNRYIILFVPMLLFLFLNFSYSIIQVPYELSPLRFLGAHNAQIMWTPIVWGELLILLFLSSMILFLWGRRKDVL